VILTLVLHPFIAHSPLSPPVDDTHPFFTSSINHALTFLTLNSSLVVNDLYDIDLFYTEYGTYDHRVWKTGLPVRSAVLKPHAGELVVGWVTTSESSLLYVFCFVLVFFILHVYP
jgi:hypothetical protein